MKTRNRSGVYAGSFDSLTVGHLWMIEQGVALFDQLVVAVGINPEKRCTFALEDRLATLSESLRTYGNLSVASFFEVLRASGVSCGYAPSPNSVAC